MSAAKAGLPEILPSKFKPKLLPPGGETREAQPAPARRPKAHSCEDLREGGSGGASAGRGRGPGGERRAGSGSGEWRTNAEFSAMYRTMHQIRRPGSEGCSPQGSVRSLASLFEREGARAGGRGGEEEAGAVPRSAVSSRVTEFEQIIQRSCSMPALHGNPGPAPAYLTAAVSAESLLVTEPPGREEPSPLEEAAVPGCRAEEEGPVCSEDVDTARKGATSRPGTEAEPETDRCSEGSTHSAAAPPTHAHAHHQHKPSKCKGTCPASYTRFTTIRRHEKQLAQRDRQEAADRKKPFPSSLFLMGPTPFRLRKTLQSHQAKKTSAFSATKATAGGLKLALAENSAPCGHSVEPKPLIPTRMSSLEVLERLSNGEVPPSSPAGGDGSQHLLNGGHVGSSPPGLDCNRNPLCPTAPHSRGGYLHHPTPTPRPSPRPPICPPAPLPLRISSFSNQ